MLSRLIVARRPRIFPGRSEADSAMVWERAAAYALAADGESGLTWSEREELYSGLVALPSMRPLACCYLALVLLVADHPVLFAVAVALIPAAVIHFSFSR